MINGRKYSWQDITVVLPYGEAIDIQDISYDESNGREAIYGKGGKPVGYSKTNQACTGKITILREELEKWERYLGGSVADAEPFPIVANYGTDGQDTLTDELKQCIISNKSGAGAAQNDSSVTVDLDLLILGGISWNGRESK